MVAHRPANARVSSRVSSADSGATAGTHRLHLLASPQVDASAEVHEFSLIEGNVQIKPRTRVAPGTAVTAEQGASVLIGEDCSLLPGVIVEAVAGAQVMGPSGNQTCSVYVSDRTVAAHKALIHSPAFIGKDCFIGFRSTIFNARLGDGCVVMMHALVQDVEIPPGRCVPSGAVINSQHQADQLPQVRPEDLEFAQEIVGSAALSRSSPASTASRGRLVSAYGSTNNSASSHAANSPPQQQSFDQQSFHQQSSRQSSRHSSSQSSEASRAGRNSNQFPHATEGANMQAKRLSPEIVQQVRQHLSQGYRIGMEHADKRRYRSGVWETCTPIKDTREQAVFEALERCLAEHSGEYVRMFGIDTKAKQRMGMVTVQRPGDKPVEASTSGGSQYGSSAAGNSQSHQSSGGLESGVAQEVRNLLNAGYQIGTEHAGPRHYRSNVWKVCSPIETRSEREVFAKLEHCLAEHSGEYIRMFGINAKSKSRTATTTIQRADGKPVEISARAVKSTGSSSSAQSSGGYSQSQAPSSGSIGDEVAQAVSQIIRGGNAVGIECADKRRYRSGIWQTAPSINASSESGAISQLQNFLSQNADKYVRIFGVNSQQKTRGASTTVQKPGQSNSNGQSQNNGVSTNGRAAARGPINSNSPNYDDPAFRGQSSGGQSGGLDAAVLNQVTQLVNQGHKISLEFADKRRYRSGIWKTGPTVSARRPAEAISELGQQLAQHSNDYVRLIGVDPNAKKRVAELTIQRPGQKPSQGSGSGSRDPINANPPHYDDPAFRGQPSSYGQSGGYNSNGQGNQSGSNGGMESAVLDQVTQLVNQGHKISLEYADKRRYRSGIWKTGSAITSRRPAEAISELGKQLAQHQGEYVRLIGTDTQAKRRVLEATIQRP